jgi:uncharacterized repeat protein (TIGR01451 family)
MKTRALQWVAVLMLAPGIAAAQGSKVEVKNQAFQEIEVVNDDGTKELKQVPAEKVMPGTEVIYVTTVKNLGDKAAEKIAVDNPMPEHMLYRGASALDDMGVVEVSVDGGRRYGVLSALEVEGAKGHKRPAVANDVTHVRFRMGQPLPPGASNRFGFRAVLR